MLAYLNRIKSFKPVDAKQNHNCQTDQRSWTILHAAENPSTDYYIKPEIIRRDGHFLERTLNEPPANTPCTGKIVIVRYLNDLWGQWLMKNSQSLSEVIYFMDDEILRPETWKNLPRDYQRKLSQNYKILVKYLPKIVNKYWVSTIRLQSKNPSLCAEVIHPTALVDDGLPATSSSSDPSRRRLIMYHATASHYQEFLWLRPIIEKALTQAPSASFEVFGDISINRLYRDIPRTRILHPMSWANYLEYTKCVKGGLALAPLLNNEFNAARSVVKPYDIRRMTDSAIYSENSAYARLPMQANEAKLPNEPDLWFETIMAWISKQ